MRRPPRSLQLAAVGLAAFVLVGTQLWRGDSVVPAPGPVLASPPAATGTPARPETDEWDAGGFGPGVGRAGVPTCRVSHMTGAPDTVRITRNVTASLGTPGNAFCHELCEQTDGCRFTRTQMGGKSNPQLPQWAGRRLPAKRCTSGLWCSPPPQGHCQRK